MGWVRSAAESNRTADVSASRAGALVQAVTDPQVPLLANAPVRQIGHVVRRPRPGIGKRLRTLNRNVGCLDESAGGTTQADAAGPGRRLRRRDTSPSRRTGGLFPRRRRRSGRPTGRAGLETRRHMATATAQVRDTGTDRSSRRRNGAVTGGRTAAARRSSGRSRSRSLRNLTAGRRHIRVGRGIRSAGVGKLTELTRHRSLATRRRRRSRRGARPRAGTTRSCRIRAGRCIGSSRNRATASGRVQMQRRSRMGCQNIPTLGNDVDRTAPRAAGLLENELKPPLPLDPPDLLDVGERPRIAVPDLRVVFPEHRNQRIQMVRTQDQLQKQRVQSIHHDLRNSVLRRPGQKAGSPLLTGRRPVRNGGQERVPGRNRELLKNSRGASRHPVDTRRAGDTERRPHRVYGSTAENGRGKSALRTPIESAPRHSTRSA